MRTGRLWGGRPRQMWRSFCQLLLLVWGLSCGPSDRAVVWVTLAGLSASAQSVQVTMTLDGRAEQGTQPTLRENLSQFQVWLPPATAGELGIHVTAQGPDGCTFQSGDSKLVFSGNTTYRVTIAMASAAGCQLIVRKLGDGAAQVVLSDDTVWDFAVPDPPVGSCPVESLVAVEHSKTFALGTTVSLRSVSNDATRGSYVAGIEGCGRRGTDCVLTIGPDTSTVVMLVARSSVCSPDRWCWEHPLPQGQDLLRAVGTSEADTWAVGDGNILHYNGAYWTAPRRITLPSTMTGVLSSTPHDIVVVGRLGYVLRLRDSQWQCPERPTTADLNDVWGASLADFWAVGGGGTILHWANDAWTSTQVAGLTQELRAVRGRSSSDIWAVGDGGTVLHYDGASWKKLPFPTTDALHGLWFSQDGKAWVVGDRGLSARMDGTQVELLTTGVPTRLRTIFGMGDQEIWAAGDSGTLLRYFQNGWAQVESGTRQHLYSISGATANNLWAVGAAGTILHYGGLYWTQDFVGRTARPLYGMSGINNPTTRSVSSIFAVGEQGTVLRSTGADWVIDTYLSSITPRTLRAVSAPTPNDVWIAGDAGTILNWDGAQVGVVGVGTGVDFYGVWAGGGSVVAVGAGGVMARRSGMTWSSGAVPSAGGRTLRAVWGMAANALWLAGDGGTLIFWNGVAAISVPVGVIENLRGVWGTAPNNVWAVGDSGRILHYDGATWSPHAQGSQLTRQNLNAVGGVTADEVYVVGDGGTLLSFDGSSWTLRDSGMLGPLYSVWGAVTGDTRVVGQGGTILLHRPVR